MNNISSICVFCGSSDQIHPLYLEEAREMGRVIARHKLQLIFGAGKTGLMGALANGCMGEGGTVIGVTPQNLNTPALIHQGLTKLEVTPDIQSRKTRMHQLADAFIALPGGFGTLDELFETLTWAQIGLHSKPVGLLNTNNYYDPLLAMIEKARVERFIYDEHKELLISSTNSTELIGHLLTFSLPDGLERWVTRNV